MTKAHEESGLLYRSRIPGKYRYGFMKM
jgi:hypothetical protein